MLGDRRVIRRDNPAVAARDVLARVEAEAGDIREGADLPTRQRRSEWMRRVGHDGDAAGFRRRHERVVVARDTCIVDGENRPCGGPDASESVVDVDRQRVLADLAEHRSRSGHRDRLDGCGEREGRHDHLVAWPDATREQCEMERRGSALHPDRVLAADHTRNGTFELGGDVTHPEPTALANRDECLDFCGPDAWGMDQKHGADHASTTGARITRR